MAPANGSDAKPMAPTGQWLQFQANGSNSPWGNGQQRKAYYQDY
jgi:hypothetical protein